MEFPAVEQLENYLGNVVSSSSLFRSFSLQGVDFHHPVQHPLLHEREELALDEALLQDKAAAAQRGGREGDAEHERGVRETQGGVRKVGGPEEGAGGENGDAGPGEERPQPSDPGGT